MSEININIPYSFFKDMFIAWFATQIRSGFTQAAERAMLKAQEHWILLDTDLRKDVVSIAKEVAHVRPYQPFTFLSCLFGSEVRSTRTVRVALFCFMVWIYLVTLDLISLLGT